MIINRQDIVGFASQLGSRFASGPGAFVCGAQRLLAGKRGLASRSAKFLRLLLFCGWIPTLLASVANCGAETPASSGGASAIAHGLQFLQKEAFRWKTSRHCAACHHASMPLWAFNEARDAGYPVDEAALKEITLWSFSDMQTNALTEEPPPRNVLNLGWVYVLLSEQAGANSSGPSSKTKTFYESKLFTRSEKDAIDSARRTLLAQIARKQAPDGSWGQPLDLRIPLGGPKEDIAILSRLALLLAKDGPAEVTECVHRAAGWISSQSETVSRQTRNFQLLMDASEGTSTTQLQGMFQLILAEQNADGGWSQTGSMASDAYATGQTLYVLARAGLEEGTPALKRGVAFLKETQREDGSWPMTSRVKAKDLSPITTAGTAWAVLGLIRSGA